MRHQLSAFTFVTLGMILGVFWTGGCGGSGGGGGAVAAQQSPVYNRIHSSTVGAVPINTSISTTEVREVTFTPSGPNDIVREILIDGTYSMTGAEQGSLYVDLLDSNDNPLVGKLVVLNPGTAVPFILHFPTMGLFGPVQVYPLTGYKLKIYTTGTNWTTSTGQINSTRVRFVTTENITVEDPSSRITG